jgi:hypothetical protein
MEKRFADNPAGISQETISRKSSLDSDAIAARATSDILLHRATSMRT